MKLRLWNRGLDVWRLSRVFGVIGLEVSCFSDVEN